MLAWIIIYRIIFNTVFLSFWEELYLVMLVLNFTGDFCFLQHTDKEVRKFRPVFVLKIVIVALISALLSDALRYTGVNPYAALAISFAGMYALLLGFFDLWSDVKQLAVCLIALGAGLLSIFVFEYVYVPLVMSAIDMKILEINNNVLINALVALPERVVDAGIILVLLGKKATALKANFMKPVLESTWLTILAVVLVLGDMIYMAIMLYNVGYYRVLVNVPFEFQVVTSVGNLLFPIFNILAFFIGIYVRENRTRTNQADDIETIKEKMQVIKVCTSNGDYDKINVILDEIEDKINTL